MTVAFKKYLFFIQGINKDSIILNQALSQQEFQIKRTFSECNLDNILQRSSQLAAKISRVNIFNGLQTSSQNIQIPISINEGKLQQQQLNHQYLSSSQSQKGTASSDSNEFMKKVKKSKKQDNDIKTSGRWTKEEHKKFIQAIKLYGKDWRKVEDFIGTRSGAQIRSHAQKYFIRISKQLQSDSKEIQILNDEKCQTSRGLELFRQTIAQYEGNQSTKESDDEDFKSQDSYKRQKFSEQKESSNKNSEQTSYPSEKSEDIKILDIPSNGILQISDLKLPKKQISCLSLPLPTSNQNESSTHSPLLKEVLSIKLTFIEITKQKENIMIEFYNTDKELIQSSKLTVKKITEILSEVQLLSHKLSVIIKVINPEERSIASNILEKLQIFIYEVMNIQKMINEFIIHHELFNKSKPLLLPNQTLFASNPIQQQFQPLLGHQIGSLNTQLFPQYQQNLLQQITNLVQQKSESSSPKVRNVQVLMNNNV